MEETQQPSEREGDSPHILSAEDRSAQTAAHRKQRRTHLSRLTVIVFCLLLLASFVPFAIGQHLVKTEDHQALQRRSDGTASSVSALVTEVRGSMRQVGGALQTDSSPAAFQRIAQSLVSPSSGNSLALINTKTTPPTVTQVQGPAVGAIVGQPLNVSILRAISSTSLAQPFSSTPIMNIGGKRAIGFIDGAPEMPSGTALYLEATPTTYDPVATQTLFGPYKDVDNALYASTQQNADQAIYASTQQLPLSGKLVSASIPVGTGSWLLTTKELHPLTDSLTRNLPWLLLGIGVILSIAVAAILEVLSRRRDYAVDLVEERTAALSDSLEQLRETQDRLVHQERLAAIGELASTVGHELRNPLGVVTNALYLLRTASGEDIDERTSRHLRTAEREVASATLIVSDLLDFARERQPIITSVDLNELLDETLSVVPPPDAIELDFHESKSLPTVSVDRDQMRQVFLNLITNAYEAMPDGGVLKVESHVDESSVVTTVTDTGIGIDEETRAHLFDPFFTQKMRGVGLGLTVTKRIVDAHHGVIDVRSEPGTGTSFNVTLPIDDESQTEVTLP